MYIHGRFKATQINVAFTSTKWEGQCVELTQSQPYAKQHVIGNIYNNNIFHTLVSRKNITKQNCYISSTFKQ